MDNEIKKGIRSLVSKEKINLTKPNKESLLSLITPWIIVQKLYMRLNLWVFKNTNIFGDEIEEVIFNVAQKQGVKTDGISAEDAWKAMGGRLFTE